MQPNIQTAITIDQFDEPIRIVNSWNKYLSNRANACVLEYRGVLYRLILDINGNKWNAQLITIDKENNDISEPISLNISIGSHKTIYNIIIASNAAILAAYLHLKVNYLLSLTNYKIEDVRENNRTKQITLLRHLLFWHLRRLLDDKGTNYYTFKEIGLFFSRRNHVTVISGIEKINRNLIKKHSNTLLLMTKIGLRLP